jgi:hypothetical protein
MKRFTLILSGVLALQLVLALALTFSGTDYAAYKADEPLLAFDNDKVDQIVIDETGANSVTLKKHDGQWLIPAMADFPAEQARVTGLLDKIGALKKGWPVATTSDAAKRFKVAAEDHERRIVLKSGDQELATLLIGSSPTYRQAHVRTASADEIYSAEISAYEAGARGEEWVDKTYLDIPQDKIASISIGDVVLEQKDGKFTLAGLSADQKAKPAELPPIVSAVTNPSFDVVQGKGKDALAKLEAADFEVTVKRTEGEPVILKYKKEGDGGAYLFASSAHPYVFRVAASTIKPLADAKREKLIEAPAKTEEPKPETDAAPEPTPPQISEEAKPDGTGG